MVAVEATDRIGLDENVEIENESRFSLRQSAEEGAEGWGILIVVDGPIPERRDGIPGKAIVRFWETGGGATTVTLSKRGFRNAESTDLLERKQGALDINRGNVKVPVRALGMR
jgi:hypothetical protein